MAPSAAIELNEKLAAIAKLAPHSILVILLIVSSLCDGLENIFFSVDHDLTILHPKIVTAIETVTTKLNHQVLQNQHTDHLHPFAYLQAQHGTLCSLR